MFQFPAFISCFLDTLTIALYLKEFWLFDDPVYMTVKDSLNPLLSDRPLVILAALRIVLFLPYLWQFQQDRRLTYATLPYMWHLLNIIIIAVKSFFNIYSRSWELSEWLLLMASAVSVLSQTICLNHLKSTALPERQVVLGFSVHSLKSDSLLGHDIKASNGTHDETLLGNSKLGIKHSEFLKNMRKRFDTAQNVWNEKVRRFKDFILGGPRTDELESVFECVLSLFMGHGDEAVKQLETMCEIYPEEVEFYIPQLVVFLLYGSFDTSLALHTAMLYMCRKSSVFAHRVYWFVVAFCLSDAGVTEEGVEVIKKLLAEIEAAGEEQAKQLALGRGYGENKASPADSVVDISLHSDDAFETKENPSSSDYLFLDTTKYPINLSRTPPNCTSYFKPTIMFWDEMITVSRNLCSVTRPFRTDELRIQLSKFTELFLPSTTIYAPFANEYHRIWAVHTEECFAFSTKDRAPFLICLEIVDYNTPKQKQDRPLWWAPDRIAFRKTFKFGQREFTLRLGSADETDVVETVDEMIQHPQQLLTEKETRNPMMADNLPKDSILLLNNAHSDRNNKEKNDIESGSSATATHTPVKSRPASTSIFPSVTNIMHSAERKSSAGAGGDITPSSVNEYMHQRSPGPSAGSATSNQWDVDIGQWGGKRTNGNTAMTAALSRSSPQSNTKKKSMVSTETHTLHRRKEQEPLVPRGTGVAAGDGEEGSTPLSHDDMFTNITGSGMARAGGDLSTPDVDEPSITKLLPYCVEEGSRTAVTSSSIACELLPSESTSSGKNSVGSSRSRTVEHVDQREREWYGSTDRTSINEHATSSPISECSNNEFNDPKPTVVFKESWKQKEARLRRTSSIGHLTGWRLLPVIVKSGDDLRQEQCASQIIFQMQHILKHSRVGCWLRPYGIVATSPDSGLIEAIPDTVSLDVLRRRDSRYISLLDFFERFFGPEGSSAFAKARNNFMRSLAGYCIVCYILQLKDRHNGNILLDTYGHIIHIDFGFILAKTPGGNMGFEKAPFKLTSEFVELLNGAHSPLFHKFRELCVRTFMELRKQSHHIVLLLEMLSKGNEHLPCFGGNPQKVLDELRARFQPELHDRAVMEHVHSLIDLAIDNWTTTCYDSYQRCCVGIF